MQNWRRVIVLNVIVNTKKLIVKPTRESRRETEAHYEANKGNFRTTKGL